MSSVYTLNYSPTPKQRLFHTSPVREILYGGAAGGGKSYASVWDAYIRCLHYPKTNAYMFRRTYPELEQTLIKTAREIIPKHKGKYNSTDHVYRLVNGSCIWFGNLQFEADKIDYQGAEIQWLYFDELTHFSESMYTYLRSRLRAPKKLNVIPVIRCTSNPGGFGHGWVKKYFVDSTKLGTKIARHEVEMLMPDGTRKKKIFTTQYIPATVFDNPYISDDYMFELMLKPPKLRDALLYGKWDAFEGQAFPEFTNDPEHYKDHQWTHVIEPFEIPRHWEHAVAYDHGYSDPFAVLAFAVSPDGTVYLYKELYGCRQGEADKGMMMSPSEIGRAMGAWLESEFREGIRPFGIADGSIFDADRGVSVEEQIRREFSGVIFSKADKSAGARIAGKNNFHEYLKFDEDGRPKLYVFSTCKEFIRTIPTLVYDEHKTEDIDTDGEDHLYDACRYYLQSRPINPKLPHEKPRKEYSPYEENKRRRV